MDRSLPAAKSSDIDRNASKQKITQDWRKITVLAQRYFIFPSQDFDLGTLLKEPT
jgi:hypothetical protein